MGLSMKIVAINASPKKGGALSTLIAETVRSAREQGAEVELLRLADLDIRYCRFCMTCYADTESPIGTCPQDDDMRWILPALREADGYILGTQVSSGHANAIMKTFIERCAYTAGSSKGKLLWLKGLPTTRFTDRRRFAVTLATAGTMPSWLRFLCDTATRQMRETAQLSFNARVVGTLYAGEQTFRGLVDSDIRKAGMLGERLVSAIKTS